MSKRTKPRAGSLAYSPRVRARRIYPRINSWPETSEVKPLAFAGYKAGMTHIMAVDKYKNSPTFEQTIAIPATILEVPPLVVFGIRAYTLTPYGKKVLTEVWAEKVDKDLKRKIKTVGKEIKSDIKKLDESVDKISEIRLLVHTKPPFKKTPEVFEVKVGGEPKAAFDYAKEKLGKEITIDDVFKEGEYVDTISVTTGKGTQGPVKRWGIKVQRRKAHGFRRHVGSMGPWHPTKMMWREPQAGQMGFHVRTEINRIILKIGKNPTEVNPVGGIRGYGVVKNTYVLVKGSVPGPKKRLILIRSALRLPKHALPLPEIQKVSTKSQQGNRVKAI